MRYFIQPIRCNQPSNNLEKEIQEAVTKYACTITENPQQVYEECCQIVAELNEKHKRCAYQVVQSHALSFSKDTETAVPHTITIQTHKLTWGQAQCTIIFTEIVEERQDTPVMPPLWAIMKAMQLFHVDASNTTNQAFEIFTEDLTYYKNKWLNCDKKTLFFISLLDNKELMIIYRAYEQKLHETYVF